MARKDEILDALLDIFKQKGVGSDFTISELAQKVNIGKSTIYEYFKTKDDILKEAIHRVIGTTIPKVINRGEIVSTSFEEAFKDEMYFLFELAENSRFLLNFITPELRRSMPDPVKEGMKEQMASIAKFYEKRFEKIFDLGVKEGILAETTNPINATLIYSLVTGSILRFANINSDLISEININEYIDALFNASIKLSN